MSRTSVDEANKVAFLRLIEEGFNSGNLSVVDEIFAPDSKEHQRGSHDGPEGAKEVIRTLRSWFPDFYMHAEDIVAIDGGVWARFKATGTNIGSVMHRPPTGKRVSIDVIDVVKFRDGKIVEHWGVPDQLGMMLQLGIAGNQPPTK